MKTRWIGSLALVFVLVAAIQFVHVPYELTASAEEPAPDNLVPEPEPESDSEEAKGPRTCPMIPIEVYGSVALYEALYYENENCPPPTFTYAYGAYTYPQTCPDCDAKKVKSPEPFYGLAMPVPADYVHNLPAGRPDEYSQPTLTPNRVEYLYLKKQGVYVKVFAFEVNRKDMENDDPANPDNFDETIYFAFECSDPASIGVNVALIESVADDKQRPIPDPGGAPTTVYDVTYKQKHILTFLCGNPEPPIDTLKPVSADQ